MECVCLYTYKHTHSKLYQLFILNRWQNIPNIQNDASCPNMKVSLITPYIQNGSHRSVIYKFHPRYHHLHPRIIYSSPCVWLVYIGTTYRSNIRILFPCNELSHLQIDALEFNGRKLIIDDVSTCNDVVLFY